MKKQILTMFTGLFIGAIITGGASAYAAGILAERSNHRIFVDGQEVQMEAYLCVKGQHSAAFTTVVTAPQVFCRVQIHFSPAVTADGTIHVHLTGSPPPDIQAEEPGHIHNAKGEIMLFPVIQTSIPPKTQNLRMESGQLAFNCCEPPIRSMAAAFIILPQSSQR